MPDVLVRDVPRRVLDALKKRAKRHGRSLQQELRELLRDRSEYEARLLDFAEQAEQMRERLLKRGGAFSDSVAVIREGRRR